MWQPSVIKPHGQLRTGTNYLTWLLASNFGVRVLGSEEGGWKHGPIQIAPDTHYIVVSKDIDEWVSSFWTWERIHGRSNASSLIDFLTAEVTHPVLRRVWQAAHPVDAWNRAYRCWFAQSASAPVLFVRHESLVRRFEETLERIEVSFGLTRLKPSFINRAERADDWETPLPRPALELERYHSAARSEPLDHESLTFVHNNVDDSLRAHLGYE